MEQFLNPYVQCPFNRAHEVPRLRLQHHIIRCRKNYEETDKRVCPFNATHIVSSAKFPAHLLKCPNSKPLEAHKYNNQEVCGDMGNPSFYDTVPFSYSWEEDSGNGSKDIRRGRENTWSEHLMQPSSGKPQKNVAYSSESVKPQENFTSSITSSKYKSPALNAYMFEDEDIDCQPSSFPKKLHEKKSPLQPPMQCVSGPSSTVKVKETNPPLQPPIQCASGPSSTVKVDSPKVPVKSEWMGLGRGRVYQLLSGQRK